ncbi:MAG: endolytic transglycosylase MltG [Tissierellia bacterium]|nr:endolytic transglycosylase MltG [Tissierellia bacterium]
MKSIFSKILDFLYALKDYVIILLIILIVVGVIAWRLDSMFTHRLSNEDIPLVSGVVKSSEGNTSNEESTAITDNNEVSSPDNTSESIPESKENKDNEKALISITVPENHELSDIDALLLQNGLITEAGKFTEKINNLGLSDKIKPGVYEIPKDYPLDDIVILVTE